MNKSGGWTSINGCLPEERNSEVKQRLCGCPLVGGGNEMKNMGFNQRGKKLKKQTRHNKFLPVIQDVPRARHMFTVLSLNEFKPKETSRCRNWGLDVAFCKYTRLNTGQFSLLNCYQVVWCLMQNEDVRSSDNLTSPNGFYKAKTKPIKWEGNIDWLFTPPNSTTFRRW